MLAMAAALLAGCAEGPQVMRYQPATAPGAAPPVWPPAPEVPRYAYAGQLTGEQNFGPLEQRQSEGLGAAFAWLVGLGLEQDVPLVLQRPQGGAIDEAGRVYVTDVSAQAVFVFDEPGAQLMVWRRASERDRFIAPIDVVPSGRPGEVLVTDAELGAVFRLGADGTPLGSFGEDVLVRPTGIARDPSRGLVYVADTRANDIKIFDDEGLLVDFIGRSGDEPGELNAPTYITFARDRLYVTDTLNSRVQVFDADGEVNETFGQRGLYVGNLTRPKGIAVDDEGNVYVVESYYDYLLVFDADGRFLMPLGGTGDEPGQFYLPAGVWIDGANRVFVADMFNGRVSVFQFLGGG